jgi:ABC-type molybdenum transport system ATPase subunit/photorepair protein PhrA
MLGCGRGLGVKVGGNQTWVAVGVSEGVVVSGTMATAGVTIQALEKSKSAKAGNVLKECEMIGRTKRNYSDAVS